MEEQKQCGCCRCDELEKELKEQIKINHSLKALVFTIKDFSAELNMLYDNVIDGIQHAENTLNNRDTKRHEQK